MATFLWYNKSIGGILVPYFHFREEFSMNYLQEIMTFQRFNQVHGLSSGQISLWYALMAANNRAGWKRKFSVPNHVLMVDSGLSLSGVKKAREELAKTGLVKLTKARHSKEMAVYEMVPVSTLLAYHSEEMRELEERVFLAQQQIRKTLGNRNSTPDSSSNGIFNSSPDSDPYSDPIGDTFI